MKTSLRKLTNALLLVALGFGLYYLGPVIHEVVTGGPGPPVLQSAPLLADSPRETAGNAYLYHSLVNLERHRTVEAVMVQSGLIEGRRVETTGQYLREGNGSDRRFKIELEGNVAEQPVRLKQVSDGRQLWTDVRWGRVGATKLHQVWRVDLRQVRKRLLPDSDPAIQVGGSAALSVDPQTLANFGGLPLLLESLRESFDFALPRRMVLRGEIHVYSMVGFWKDSFRDRLFADTGDGGLPSRAPHHVLVAIGAEDLFPYLIEYRGVNDRLSAANVHPDERYFQSSQALFRLEFRSTRLDATLPQDYLAEELGYSPPEGVDWTDRTNERLDMIQQRRQLAIAQQSDSAVRSASPPRAAVH